MTNSSLAAHRATPWARPGLFGRFLKKVLGNPTLDGFVICGHRHHRSNPRGVARATPSGGRTRGTSLQPDLAYAVSEFTWDQRLVDRSGHALDVIAILALQHALLVDVRFVVGLTAGFMHHLTRWT